MKEGFIMKYISLLPADVYTVINKTILTEYDRRNIINLYEPIVGSLPISLYLTLWSDLDKREIIRKTFNHHHLMTLLKTRLDDIKDARKALEAVGLLKSYLKKGESLNSYVYELFSPLSAYEFFNHPVLNVVLYNNIGGEEYNCLVKYYKKITFNYSDYEDVSAKLNMTFTSTPGNFLNGEEIKDKSVGKPEIEELIDFNLLASSISGRILNEKTLNKKNKELINSLAFVYNLDTLKMSELLRLCLDESGSIDRELLKKEVRRYYEYNNGGKLPTLIYRTQPDYLKAPEGDLSNRGKMVYIFENTTPYDFIRSKYKIGTPTSSDLKILEYLAVDLNMTPAVINVLVDYVLRINNNKLTKAFVETIAGQWARLGIKTARDAMKEAEKEYKKKPKKETKTISSLPVWFNEETQKKELSEEEQKEMEALLKEFR